MGSPAASRKLKCVALRAFKLLAQTCSEIPRAAGPDTRTTPMAPRPEAVAIATIVSNSSTMRCGLLLNIFHHHPLLRDRQNVIH